MAAAMDKAIPLAAIGWNRDLMKIRPPVFGQQEVWGICWLVAIEDSTEAMDS